MTSFAAAYLLVWGAIALYVIRLGAGQRRLRRDIETLSRLADQSDRATDGVSRAA